MRGTAHGRHTASQCAPLLRHKAPGSLSQGSNRQESLSPGSRSRRVVPWGDISGSPAEPAKRSSSFCGGGVSSAFEIGGVGEPLKIFTLSFEHTPTTCWIHKKLRCHLAALLEFRAQFIVGQN